MASMKSVLITGCSDDGIGSALAIEFQRKGFMVYATLRDLNKTKKLQDLENVRLLQMDVTKADQVEAARTTVLRETGGSLNYLVNNAGANHFMPILDEDIETCKKLYETNVWGPVAVTKAFAPLLIEAKGTVAFTTSISGYINVPYMGTYSASKRSIEIMAETLRLELAPFGVKVLSVVTGAVQTQGQSYFGDWKLPEDSYFKSIEHIIAKRARGDDGASRMPVADYATKVVSQIISGTTGKFWYGDNTAAVRFGTTWLPQWLMDMGLTKGTGLENIK